MANIVHNKSKAFCKTVTYITNYKSFLDLTDWDLNQVAHIELANIALSKTQNSPVLIKAQSYASLCMGYEMWMQITLNKSNLH